ncbi:hypothetical protein BGW39_006538 [Mortierella sp. 14UC]|nr:hypothetical protein BGW39_006538 [Mortierella sp. 14UC]
MHAPYPEPNMNIQQQGHRVCVPTTFNTTLGGQIVMLEAIYAALGNPNRISLFFNSIGSQRVPIQQTDADGGYIHFHLNRVLVYKIEQDDDNYTSSDEYHDDTQQHDQNLQDAIVIEAESSEESSPHEAISSPTRLLTSDEEQPLNRTTAMKAQVVDGGIEHEGGQQQVGQLSQSVPTSMNATALVDLGEPLHNTELQHVELRPFEPRSTFPQQQQQQQQPLGPLLAAPVFNLLHQRYLVFPIPTPGQSTPSSSHPPPHHPQGVDTSAPAPVPGSMLLFNSGSYPGLVYRVGMRVGRVLRWFDGLDGGGPHFGPEFDVAPPPFHRLSPTVSDNGEGGEGDGDDEGREDSPMRGDHDDDKDEGGQDQIREEEGLEEQQNYPIAEDYDDEDEDDEDDFADEDEEDDENDEDDEDDEDDGDDKDEAMDQGVVDLYNGSLDGLQQNPVVQDGDGGEEEVMEDAIVDQGQEQDHGVEGVIEKGSLSGLGVSDSGSAPQEKEDVVKQEEQATVMQEEEAPIRQEDEGTNPIDQDNHEESLNQEFEEDFEGSLSAPGESDSDPSSSPKDKDIVEAERVEPRAEATPKRKRSNKDNGDDDECHPISGAKKVSKKDGGNGGGGCGGGASGARCRSSLNK